MTQSPPQSTPQSPPTPQARLPWRDSPRAYGRISRLLHWSMAAMMLFQFTGMVLRALLGRHPLVGFFVEYHQSLGSLLFVLVALRLGWALANRPNRPQHGAGLLGRAAQAGHGMLYLLMLAMPAFGILRSWGWEWGYAPFGLQLVAPRSQPIAWAVDLGDALHGPLAWALLVLIGGHVGMVGLHASMWRDGTLARMLGRG